MVFIFVDPAAALFIGAMGGIIAVIGVLLLEKLKIDDPVGAVPVHGFNGIWGTLSVGLFGHKALGLSANGLFYGGDFSQLGIQTVGVVTVTAFIVVSLGVVFKLINMTIGLRVSREEELRGLDIGEHGMESYADFQIFATK
jgi:Amt family ammonium transporter